MNECNGRKVPLSVGTDIVAKGETLDVDKFPYSTLVGSLLYLSVCTRPDIAQAVGVLARHMAAPTVDHWNAAKGVLRYLAGTNGVGLLYGKGTGLIGYCDSDYAGDVDTRRSTTGYAFVLHGGVISWSSKLQPTVAVSTIDSEYMAASAAVKDALWLRMLCADFDMPIGKVKILCDNQGCIRILKDAIASVRSKHIDVMHHFARERVARGEVMFEYVDTSLMAADMLTKALPPGKLMKCRDLLSIR